MKIQCIIQQAPLVQYQCSDQQCGLSPGSPRFKSYHSPNYFSYLFLNLSHQSIPDVFLVLKYAKILLPSVGLMSQFPIMAPVKPSDRYNIIICKIKVKPAYRLEFSHWWKMYLSKKFFTRFALQSEFLSVISTNERS